LNIEIIDAPFEILKVRWQTRKRCKPAFGAARRPKGLADEAGPIVKKSHAGGILARSRPEGVERLSFSAPFLWFFLWTTKKEQENFWRSKRTEELEALRAQRSKMNIKSLAEQRKNEEKTKELLACERRMRLDNRGDSVPIKKANQYG